MDDQHKMDAAENAAFQRWWETHWRHGPCSVCGNKAWGINQRIAHFVNEQTPVDGSVYPVLLIFCHVCGYTIPINAYSAGVRGPVKNGSSGTEGA